MSFKIGFTADHSTEHRSASYTEGCAAPQARRSIVRVFFPTRNTELSYYNDSFDLHPGDIVYVDGKLEGLRGRGAEVSYNFKIKLSDYKRVVAVADTEVHGQFFMAGSHFVSFDADALPRDKARSWYLAPRRDDEELVSGSDGEGFLLSELGSMKISGEKAERGHGYYVENRVRYISVDGGRGYALVEGSRPYEVEFRYDAGRISALSCSCYCPGGCKHEFAAMLQLRETLDIIHERFPGEYDEGGFFCAIAKGELFSMAVDGKKGGSFTL